jgi:hypothetical protein
MAIEPIPKETGNREQGTGISKGEVAAAEVISESTAPTAPEVTDEARTALPTKADRGVLEARMEAALAELSAPSGPTSATIRQGHLALLKRWYYRAEIRRSGEIFFPNAEGRWPVKALLRGVGRIAGKMVAAGNHSG